MYVVAKCPKKTVKVTFSDKENMFAIIYGQYHKNSKVVNRYVQD